MLPLPAVATKDARPLPDSPPFLSLKGIGKTYGSTRANEALTLDIAPGEILGLIGANGAGKSTLMRIVCGVTRPDDGMLYLNGRPLDLDLFSARAAQQSGIRIVWQELSLCANLSVADNFYVEQPERAGAGPFWRAAYHRFAGDSIEAIFPGTGIATGTLVADLTLAERQMVEIARVASDPALRLLILDEPTSSLGTERSAQLRRYVRARADAGLAAVFISHKLAEVLDVSDRIVAMRNGRIVWQQASTAATVPDMIEAMGGPGARDMPQPEVRPEGTGAKAETLLRIDVGATAQALGSLTLSRGEIVGLAGLEGSGQKALLQRIFSTPESSGVKPGCRVRIISGDRQKEGVFPLWSVLQNISIGRIARRGLFAPVRDAVERPAAAKLAARLQLDENRLGSNILDLSGGNQQKALVARALADDFDILLLDDPTRGVDIAAKRDVYRLVQEIARTGRLVLWYSTEDLEFLECDRVLVFSKSRIIRDLNGSEIDEETIVASAFAEQGTGGSAASPSAPTRRFGPAILKTIPFVSLLAVFAIMTAQNPLVASSFGIELLLAPAVPLVLIALAQMFVVGGSEIDLGAGAFTGLVNVISATLLVSSPLLGTAALVAGLGGYALMGVLIQARAIPAIVVTLGASFIWIGTGQTLQASPGGDSPEWLTALFSWSVAGLPTPLVLILLAGVIAVLIDGSATGTILRGFGANARALTRAGWSPVRYAVYRYGIACLFATTAGLYVTATNHASDINASSSFTLLSVAAVVMGGCQLLGGMIAPAGVVAGAVTLSLIGALLASLGISTDFNAAVQGGLLIAMLGVQALLIRRKRHA